MRKKLTGKGLESVVEKRMGKMLVRIERHVGIGRNQPYKRDAKDKLPAMNAMDRC